MLVEIMKINKEDVTVVTSLDVAETFEMVTTLTHRLKPVGLR